MVVLRRTRKLASALPASASPSVPSDTALGDWYVNRITIHRRPLLLLVSARGLLPVLLPARDVSSLPERLSEVVAARMQRLGVASPVIRAEVAAMTPVVTAPTIDRSVLGIMVDFAKLLPFYLDRGARDESSLVVAEAKLAENPCHAGRQFKDVVFPNRKAPELLLAHWQAG